MNVSSVSSIPSVAPAPKPLQAALPNATPQPSPGPVPAAVDHDGDSDDRGSSPAAVGNSFASALTELKLGG